jgi:DNA mismatch repair protein MutS2
MAFAAGDFVHVKLIGKGIVREVRNAGRYLVDISGRLVVTSEDQMTAHDASPQKTKRPVRKQVYELPDGPAASIDLHGLTVEEAMEKVTTFLDHALRSGASEAHVIHGRSSGKIKAALHAQLKRIPSIRGFGVDPRNPGVTIVEL